MTFSGTNGCANGLGKPAGKTQILASELDRKRDGFIAKACPPRRKLRQVQQLPTLHQQLIAMGSRLLNAPIVLDNGSGTIRAGFAGQDLPKCYFPSFVGRPKHVRALAGALEGDIFIGPRAQELRGLLKINYPLEQYNTHILWPRKNPARP